MIVLVDWRQVWQRGIGCSLGDADTSFKTGDEIDAFVNVSLLATLLLWYNARQCARTAAGLKGCVSLRLEPWLLE